MRLAIRLRARRISCSVGLSRLTEKQGPIGGRFSLRAIAAEMAAQEGYLGFMICVMDWSTRGLNKARDALPFAKLTNDGDDEGAFFLSRMPSKAEAEGIRKWTGIPKFREVGEPSPAQLVAREAFAARRRAEAA